MPLDASAVAKLLHEFGQRTALRGGKPYRAQAYSRAARKSTRPDEPLEQIVAEDRLREIPGVGDAVADIIAKLHKTGTHAGLEAMRKDIPAGVLELLSVPGLRPEKVLKLYSELGIASLEGLEQAARQDRLKNVKGLGAALQSMILQGIDIKRRGDGQRHLHRAAAFLQAAEANLRRSRTPASHALRLPATSVAVANWSPACRWWRKSRSSTEERRSA
jgi:DNA polymerase (family X)